MIKTYKYRIKDRSAAKHLRAHAYACNQVWNWCAAQHKDVEARYFAGTKRKWLSHFDLMRECRGVGAMLGIHQQTVNNVCEFFVRSRTKYRHAPRFRSSFGSRCARGWVPFQKQSRSIEGNSVTYLGRKYRLFGSKRRPIPSDAKGGFFVEDALGRWFLCIHVEVEAASSSTGSIGVDLGLDGFATLSNGEIISSPRFLRKEQALLSRHQRCGSERRAKVIHLGVANRRRDFHHKLSTRLAREYALIAVGDVNAKSLAKTWMAKSAFDAGWSSFRNMLAYKAAQFVLVDEKFTTQTCSSCGVLPPERPRGIAGLGIREWVCSSCGESHDRDVNAAKNILRIGYSTVPLVEGIQTVAPRVAFG